jgi:c-di-GMP-binding flagellar brake protein YcgR
VEKDFFISNPERIAWVLKSLKDDHQLIDVDFDNSDDLGTGGRSIVLDVDLQNKQFSIDELRSRFSHDHASKGAVFSISSSLNGLDIMVPGLTVIDIQQDDNGDIYVLELPKTMQYVQRRESFRARVTGLAEVPVDIGFMGDSERAKEDESLTSGALLADISAEGCRIVIADNGQKTFADEDLFLALNLKLPTEEDPTKVSAKVCHSRYLERSKVWYLGCQFDSINIATQQVLDRFVVQMQRLARQKDAMFD